MLKYKIVASKSNKKYSLILVAPTELEARERIHKEGYSILSLQIADESTIQGKKFIFEMLSENAVKKGVIIGNDILKSYIKLVDELGYNVISMYPEEDDAKVSDEEKAKIIFDLRRGLEIMKSREIKIPLQKNQEISLKEANQIDDSFYLKKELEETQRLISKVIEKLGLIITKNDKYKLDPEKLEKLNALYGNIVTLKKSTNISKLKQVGELALVKIGDIELGALEIEKSTEEKKYLSETNQLLKKIGSNKQFREKNRDIHYIMGVFIDSIWFKIQNFKNIRSDIQQKKKDKLIDKDSYSYLKTLLLLEKYNQKLKQNNKEIFKNIFAIILPYGSKREISENILIKRRVIIQNISLLNAKKLGTLHSYTLVVKGYHKFVEIFFVLLHQITNFFYYIIYVYSFCFILYSFFLRLGISIPGIQFNFKGLSLFIGILCITFLGSLSKNIILFTFNFVFFLFLLIFSIVNF